MRHVLAILCLALVGCVTVQPCVCPAPAPKVEPPASGFVYDGAIEGHTLPHVPKTGITLTEPGSVWYDGCNWHRPLGYGLEGVTLMGCNLDTSLTRTPPAADPGTSNLLPYWIKTPPSVQTLEAPSTPDTSIKRDASDSWYEIQTLEAPTGTSIRRDPAKEIPAAAPSMFAFTHPGSPVSVLMWRPDGCLLQVDSWSGWGDCPKWLENETSLKFGDVVRRDGKCFEIDGFIRGGTVNAEIPCPAKPRRKAKR